MNTFLKVLRTVGAAFLVLSTILIILIVFQYKETCKIVENFCAFSPASCPNTKWVCEEENIYFISDSDGKLSGQVGTPEDYECFTLSLGARSATFAIYKPSQHRENTENFVLNGKTSYSENTCILTYDADDDEEHFWGDKTGEVTLTFIKEDLP